jgi:glutamyl-Q tRNA(Asp) synthetase
MSRWRVKILLSTVATACSPIIWRWWWTIISGVTEIVRGADLIEPTVRQISLYQHFGWQAPDYIHLPLALNARAINSKQNHAPALPEGDPRPEIVRALRFLNQDIARNGRP